MNPLAILILGFLTSWLLGFPAYRALARFQILDLPGQRSSHTNPTVRGGGVAIMLVLVAGIALLGFYGYQPPCFAIAAGALLLAVVSFIDDLKNLPAALRFACHALCAAAFLWILDLQLPSIGVGHPSVSIAGFLLTGLLFFWIAGYTNAFNFMDGINGISAFQAGITGIGTAAIVALSTPNPRDPLILSSLLVAGAALGFLPHNFPKARMFMGDVSSAPLGFILASLAVWGAAQYGWWLLPPLFALHANYILDTGITLVRRIARGEKWYQPHREHFYQRLIRAGKSHSFVTGWEAALQIIVLGLLLFYPVAGSGSRILILAAILALWAMFFACAEFSFRKATQRLVNDNPPRSGKNTSPA